MFPHMSRRPRPACLSPILVTLALAVASGVSGQTRVDVRGSTLFEAYDLSQNLGSIDRVSELSVPLTVRASFGPRTTLVIASGYARVTASDGGQEISSLGGILDTEMRVTYQAVPDRVTVFATSQLPTGIKSLQADDLSALGVLVSDVIGFSSPNLGGGGGAGGGAALSLPAGDMAVGMAGSFRVSGTYQPFAPLPGQDAQDFRPGAEVRLRAGIEGPVAQRSFLRVSGIFARRGEDKADGNSISSASNRITGYVSLDQGLGSTTLSVYAFDLYRSAAGLESTSAGPSILSRGNIFAVGAQVAIPLRVGTSLAPRFEVRNSRAESDGTSSGLQRLGTTIRFGVDLRRSVRRGLTAVLRADGLSGYIVNANEPGRPEIDVTGYRVSLLVEIVP